VVSDVILSTQGEGDDGDPVLTLCRALAEDDTIAVDDAVYTSETATGDRNRALGYFMLAEGNIEGDVIAVTNSYFRQCSIAMSCKQLAMSGRFLAAGGQEDLAITPERSRRINALMMTCGCYDASGEIAFRIGLPCKSGVGGGLLAIAPNRASIAAWCPGLDEKGNSVLAMRAIEELARATGWSVF
jgi:glutaminase